MTVTNLKNEQEPMPIQMVCCVQCTVHCTIKLDAGIEKIRSYIDDPGNNQMFMLESRNMPKKTGQKHFRNIQKQYMNIWLVKDF